MAKDKKSFLLYCDYIETFEDLDDDEAGRLIKHIFRYVNDLNPEAPDKLTKVSFNQIRLQLKRDLLKYEQIRERNAENARKRWDKNNATAYDRIPKYTKNADTDTVTDTDTVIDINIRELDFTKKVKQEFKETYTAELLEEFCNHWTQHGEKDKKMLFEKQKSFEIKKRLITWHRNSLKFNKNTETITSVKGGKKLDL